MNSTPNDLLDRLFKAIDSKDAAQFVSFLAEDGEFRFGNAPAVKGREAGGDSYLAKPVRPGPLMSLVNLFASSSNR